MNLKASFNAGGGDHAEHHVERLARREPESVHGLAVFPCRRQAVHGRPGLGAEYVPARYRVGADQALVAGMQQGDVVEHDGGVAVVGERIQAEGERVADASDRADKVPSRRAEGTVQRAVGGRAAMAAAPGRCQRPGHGHRR
ncbi:MAG: hypothetical protein ACRDPO_28210 [Streptosporangiaceae bacterium]